MLIIYASLIDGHMILVLIDAHSKWIEAFPAFLSTSNAVIEELRNLFARFGIPETLVSDNCTCFVNNGIHHITSPPYHSSSNGLAECAVKIDEK